MRRPDRRSRARASDVRPTDTAAALGNAGSGGPLRDQNVPLWTSPEVLSALVLEVWDHDDIGRDDRMGRVDLPLSDLLDEVAATHHAAERTDWWTLGNKSRRGTHPSLAALTMAVWLDVHVHARA